ncbi:MAG: DNA alkylation repair protein [Clostridia bacterium]|nr:DNA alkylation repair protein [Lachnospiraceae bacterium]NCC00302.1 DNA alkylation repair protein [Clostridia bacterium]NCD02326.1 DNA alkylation repair protein [Clostridia bacterium]
MQIEAVREELRSMADEGYREFHSKLLPGTDNILGVRVPELRKMARRMAKEDWTGYFDAAPNMYYEEDMLRGLILGYASLSLEDRLEYLRRFLPSVSNWAVCDCVCSGLKFTEKHREEVWAFLQDYFTSEQTYDLRFASVMALDYYTLPEYAPAVFKYFDKMMNKDYYVQMAVAWAVSVFYVKLPELTGAYIESNHLDDFTHNKAIQKICESYRVTKEEKVFLRTLKRKKKA